MMTPDLNLVEDDTSGSVVVGGFDKYGDTVAPVTASVSSGASADGVFIGWSFYTVWDGLSLYSLSAAGGETLAVTTYGLKAAGQSYFCDFFLTPVRPPHLSNLQ
jgi:hypothetical protein